MLARELEIWRESDEYRFRIREQEGSQGFSALSQDPASRTVPEPVVQELLRRMARLHTANDPVPREKVLEIGEFIDQMLTERGMLESIWQQETAETPLIISTNDPRIPWELGGLIEQDDGYSCLGERIPVGRRCIDPHAGEVASSTADPPPEGARRALIIADPTDNLKGAQEEARALKAHLSDAGWLVETLMARQATHGEIFTRLYNQSYRLIHLCCHVVSTGGRPSIPTSDPKEPLESVTVESLKKLAGSVVFINGCSSAMQHDAESSGDPQELVAGMAHAFARAGSFGVVGSVWRTHDEDARLFAERLYADLVEGESLGYALRNARRIDAEDAATPASFVLYGDPRQTIQTGVGRAPESPGGSEQWPPEGMFDEQAESALRRAAAAAAEDESRLTSLHLGLALMEDDDYPLAEWLNNNGYWAEYIRALFAHSGLHLPLEEADVPGETPKLSPTLRKIWAAVEESPERPAGIEKLTTMLIDEGAGVFGDMLQWLCVDLSAWPEPAGLPDHSATVEQVWERAVELALWDDGLLSSSRMLLAILEGETGHLVAFLKSRGQFEPLMVELKEKLLDGDPSGTAQDVVPSPNVYRIVTRARSLAKDAGKDVVEVDELVRAACELEAGGFGERLKEIGYDPDSPEGEEDVRLRRDPEPGPRDVPDTRTRTLSVELELETKELIDRATACAANSRISVVGTPHVVAAAVRFNDSVRKAVRDCGYDPEDVLDTLLNFVGAPRSGNPFEEAASEGMRPPLSRNVSLALSRAARELPPEIPLDAATFVAAILTQASGSTPRLLQRDGIEPHRIAVALESGQ